MRLFKLMVSESDQLVSFFKEKAWYQYGGASQDIDVDYINPNPQEDKSVTIRAKENWGRVKTIGGKCFIGRRIYLLKDKCFDQGNSNFTSPYFSQNFSLDFLYVMIVWKNEFFGQINL